MLKDQPLFELPILGRKREIPSITVSWRKSG